MVCSDNTCRVGGTSRTGRTRSAVAGAGRRSQVGARCATTRTVASPALSSGTVSRPASTVISARSLRGPQKRHCERGTKTFSARGTTRSPCTSSILTGARPRPSAANRMTIGVRLPMPGRAGSMEICGGGPMRNQPIATATAATAKSASRSTRNGRRRRVGSPSCMIDSLVGRRTSEGPREAGRS